MPLSNVTIDGLLLKLRSKNQELDACETEALFDLLEELKAFREGGLTEDVLRRNDGYILVGKGCAIVQSSDVFRETLPCRTGGVSSPVTMPKFIELPNGAFLHSETIKAIRLGDPRPSGTAPCEAELKPRVIVDFAIGDHGNCIVLDCDSVEQRNALAADLKAKVTVLEVIAGASGGIDPAFLSSW